MAQEEKTKDTVPDSPISPFKAKQNILFQLLTARIEDWSEKTFCARILLRNGAQMEVQATKAAFDQWKNLPKYVVHTAEIARSVLKPYKGADKTGIQNDYFIRTQLRLPNLQRAVATFPLMDVKDRDIADPSNLDQFEDDQIFNVGGYVHGVEPPQPTTAATIPRRKLELTNGEWHFTVTVLGDMTRAMPKAHTKLVIYSVKKRAWQGLLTLETTRLSWFLEDPKWLNLPDPSEGPRKKALRSETLPVVTLADVKQADGHQAACVHATMQPFTEDILGASLWVGQDGDRMRLPIILRDSTGMLHCTLWSSEFGSFVPRNVEELSNLFAACESGDEAKATFLKALNANANKLHSWTLRPRIWSREQGETEVQWHVAHIGDDIDL